MYDMQHYCKTSYQPWVWQRSHRRRKTQECVTCFKVDFDITWQYKSINYEGNTVTGSETLSKTWTPYKNHTHTAYLWHFYRPCAPISLGAWSSVLSGNWGSPLWWSWSRPQRNPAPWPALKQQHTHQKENTCLEKVKKNNKDAFLRCSQGRPRCWRCNA